MKRKEKVQMLASGKVTRPSICDVKGCCPY